MLRNDIFCAFHFSKLDLDLCAGRLTTRHMALCCATFSSSFRTYQMKTLLVLWTNGQNSHQANFSPANPRILVFLLIFRLISYFLISPNRFFFVRLRFPTILSLIFDFIEFFSREKMSSLILKAVYFSLELK